jgi:beta-mannosidase
MESALYISQLYQAGQIKQSIENYRLKGENCIGFANLEIYDPIPVSFGNSIDFSGRTKPAYYYLKDSYAANIIVAQADGLFVNVYAINDELKDVDAILLCKTIDFYGNTYYVKQIPVTVKANSNALLLRLSKKELLNALSVNKVALLLQLNQPGRTNAQNIYYFAEPKLLELPKTSIKVDINQTNQGFNVILKSSVLVRNLFMETNRPDTRFSDNNIDLLPGKRYKIVVSYKGSRDELTKNLVIKSLNNLLTGL